MANLAHIVGTEGTTVVLDSTTGAPLAVSDDGSLTTTARNLLLRMEEGTTYTYFGKAVPGTSESEEKWQIKRLTNSTSAIDYAGSDPAFSHAWSERSTYTYG